MRLIEVVVLMGAHCVSPVAHTQSMTEAGKVQCAVVVQKDTENGAVIVTPEEARQEPRVAEVVARFNAMAADSAGARIVPAWAPAGEPASATKPAKTPNPSTTESIPATSPISKQESPAKTAETVPPPQGKSQCKGTAVAKWYRNAEGRRKYRCVTP